MELKGFQFVLLIVAALVSNSRAENNFAEPCDSEIYCYGPFLETMQLNSPFEDDKTFVDLPLKQAPATVLEAFYKLDFNGSANGNETITEILKSFITDHFDVNGTEFQDWTPSDWVPNPSFLSKIADEELKIWATTLHGFWEVLGRLIKDDVKNNPSMYSMHYVSHPAIVPGGRFKEFYYWDSYWIQKGLIVSEMFQTVRGMIENFFEMVETLGFIPNGGRVYYERSQPPLLIPMVKNYYDATKNITFISKNIATMKKEFAFFMTNRTVEFQHGNQTYRMARYNVDRKGPRPESYSKDYELVEPLNLTPDEKEILYANLKAGAESGWDFSSRWFVVPQGETGNLSHVKTRDMIPADLNGFMYQNAVILADFCQLINVPTECNSTYYQEVAAEWKRSIKDVLWDEETGSWYDYDFVRKELRKQFYPTNLVPLWVKAHHPESILKVVNYFVDTGATKFPGGIPSSMSQTGEQWDFPNGWAPLNHMVVEALEYSGNADAQGLAFDLAQKWTRTNYIAYNKTQLMFEKYDVSIEGGLGGGGEYPVVVGFGWTNGVILDFLNLYGDRMTTTAPIDQLKLTSSSTSTQIGIAYLLINAVLIMQNLY